MADQIGALPASRWGLWRRLVVAIPLVAFITAGSASCASAPVGPGRLITGWTSTSTAIVRQAGTPVTTAQTTGLKTVTVSSIPALKTALADNSVDVIVVANGTYHVSPSSAVASDSLWIGSAASGGFAFDARTRPITVRAATPGGVTFDGTGNAGPYGALSFEDGAHDQTWDGFNFTNMKASLTGIIEVGGYLARRTPYNITIRNMSIASSCTGGATTPDGHTTEHGIYIAHAVGVGPHDLLFEDITVDGRGGLASAVQLYHGDATNPGAWNVMVRRLHVIGTQQAIIVWNSTLRNITFDTADITNALAYAVRYEDQATGIVFSNITSTGSGYKGFYSSLGTAPPGVTFVNDVLH